ncbi:MAG: hypothetical protein AMXMBFR46_25410 [Acidimicrobiia bacterium]
MLTGFGGGGVGRASPPSNPSPGPRTLSGYDTIAALMRPGVDPVSTLSELCRPPAWHADAACVGRPVAMFFPAVGEPLEPARAVCARCLVVDECLAFALGDRDAFAHGVWGGTSGRERRTLRRQDTAGAP